jgi:RNA polymerase sigma-70 factor (ECF subfamily)
MSGNHDPELIRRLGDAISNLPRLQRDIFLAHRLNDLSYKEIGRRTGLTAKQVERHMARAISKIGKQMDGYPLSWGERRF